MNEAPRPRTVAELSSELLNRLQEGQTYASAAELKLAEQLGSQLATAANVHANAFSPQRYRDLLGSPTVETARARTALMPGAAGVALPAGQRSPQRRRRATASSTRARE